jgi:restriction endonuclease
MTEKTMNHVPKTTPDVTQDQIERLRQIFPECVTEGKVDFDLLRATLGDADALAGDDAYTFTWAGKQDVFLAIQTPIRIEPIKVRTERARVDHIREQGTFETALLGQGAVTVEREYEIPNITAALAEETHLTRRTLRRILERAGNLDQVFVNPAEYIQRVGEAVNRAKRRFLVSGVQYVEIGDGYEMSLFEDLEGYEDGLLPIEKSIYDHVAYDSGVERDFALELEQMDEVKLFVKLPDWFVVPTPIGDYNPDWAVVFHVQDGFGETREKLYLVRETKGSVDVEELRSTEQMKIDCARRHFEAIEVDYDVVAGAEEFRQRILAKHV